jgi:regulator of RNase E activity RraA
MTAKRGSLFVALTNTVARLSLVSLLQSLLLDGRILPYGRNYGGVVRFAGPASTVKCFENNPLVRKALEVVALILQSNTSDSNNKHAYAGKLY